MRIERKSKSLCYYIAKYIFVLLPLLLLLGGVLFPNHTINNIYALDDEVLISTSSSYNTELSIVSTSENTSTSQDISSSESISSDVSSSDNVVSNSVRLGYHDTYSLNVNDVNFDYFYAFDISNMPDGSSILIECPIFMIFDVQYTEPSLDYLGTYNADNIYYDYIYIDYSTDDGFNVIFGYYGEDYSYQPLFNVYCETINDFVVVGRTFGNKSSFINVIRYIDDIIGQEQQILIDISYADLFPNTEYNYNYTTFVYADYTQVNDYYTTNQYTTYTDRYDTYEYYTYTQSYDSDCIVESTDIRSYNMSFIDPLFSFYELEINEWYGYILDVFGVDTTQHTILLYLLYYPIYLLWFELLHVISLCFSFIPKLFNRWLNKVGDE